MKINLKKNSRFSFHNLSYFIENPFVIKIEQGSARLFLNVKKKKNCLHASKNAFLLQNLKTKKKDNSFFNRSFDKNKLKALISWSILSFGEKKTIDLVEKLKTVGYAYATKAGISLGIDDLKIPSAKKKYLRDAQENLDFKSQEIKKGHLTSIEFFSQVIEIWNKTSEILKEEVIENFKKTDELNPVFLMAFSGARGNISQVRQLVGLRGLMSDVQGQIINYPILSNFREGLTLTEYVISCYGARKGVVDTALRTATSGYLTRRLVDVAQHVIVRSYNCGTERGVYLSDLKKGQKTILGLKNRILGRRLAEDIFDNQKECLAVKNQEITKPLALLISKIKTKVLVRSPLTCLEDLAICQLCYGWSLSSLRLVPLGEAVGTIAAQSIGEPGTQLTMRTFHTGGVFSGEVSEEIKAPFKGIISFNKSLTGKLTRTAYGQLAFLTKQEGFLWITSEADVSSFSERVSEVDKTNRFSTIKKKPQTHQFLIPAYSLLFVKQNQWVEKDQVLAEESSFLINTNQSVETYQTIYSDFSGEVRFKKGKRFQRIKNKIVVLRGLTKKTLTKQQREEKTFAEKKRERRENRRRTIFNRRGNSTMGEFWVLSAQKQAFLKPIHFLVQKGDFLHKKAIISLTKTNSEKSALFVNPFLSLNASQKELQNPFSKIVAYDYGHPFFSMKGNFSKNESTATFLPSVFSHRFFLNFTFFNTETLSFRKGFLFQKSDTFFKKSDRFIRTVQKSEQRPKKKLKNDFQNNLQTSYSLFHSKPDFILLSPPPVAADLKLLKGAKTEDGFFLNSKNGVEKARKEVVANTEQDNIQSEKKPFSSNFFSEVKPPSHQIGFLPFFKTKTGGFGIQENSANVFQSPLKTSTLFLLSQTLSYANKVSKLQDAFTSEMLQDFKLKTLNFSFFHSRHSGAKYTTFFSKKTKSLVPIMAVSNFAFKIKTSPGKKNRAASKNKTLAFPFQVLPRKKGLVKKHLFEFYNLWNRKKSSESVDRSFYPPVSEVPLKKIATPIFKNQSGFFFADKQKLKNFSFQKSFNKNSIICRNLAFATLGIRVTEKQDVSFKQIKANLENTFFKEVYPTTLKTSSPVPFGFNKNFFENVCGYSLLEDLKNASLLNKNFSKHSEEVSLLSPLLKKNPQRKKSNPSLSLFAVTKAKNKFFPFLFSLEKVQTKFVFMDTKKMMTCRLVSLNSPRPVLEKSWDLKILPLQKSSWSLQKKKSWVEKTLALIDLSKKKLPTGSTNSQIKGKSWLLISLSQLIKQQVTNDVHLNRSWEYVVPKRNRCIWFPQNQKILKAWPLEDLRSVHLSGKKTNNKNSKRFHFSPKEKLFNGRGNLDFLAYNKRNEKNFQIEKKTDFEGWSFLQTSFFSFLNDQNKRFFQDENQKTTDFAMVRKESTGSKRSAFEELYDLKKNPFLQVKKKKISQKNGNLWPPSLKKLSLSRVFLKKQNHKQELFFSKSFLTFCDPQLYILPPMFLKKKDQKLAFFTFSFTKKVEFIPGLSSLVFRSFVQTQKRQQFSASFGKSQSLSTPLSRTRKKVISAKAGSHEEKKSFQVRIINKSDLLFSLFYYQIFQKTHPASLFNVFLKPKPVLNVCSPWFVSQGQGQADLEVTQYKSHLLHQIPVFDVFINSARFFNVTLKAKQLFFKNFEDDLETSYKQKIPVFLKTKGLTLKPSFFGTIQPQNISSRSSQPLSKFFPFAGNNGIFLKKKQLGFQMTHFNSFDYLFEAKIKRKNRKLGKDFFFEDAFFPFFFQLKNFFYNSCLFQNFLCLPLRKEKRKDFSNLFSAATKKKVLHARFYNTFSDHKFYSDYGFIRFLPKIQIKKLKKVRFPSNYGYYLKKPDFKSQNFKLSFLLPKKKNVYQSSKVAFFSNQIRNRVFKNLQQTFCIYNQKILNVRKNVFFPVSFIVPKSSQIKKDFKRKKSFDFRKTLNPNFFLNTFTHQYFRNKWFSQITVENRKNANTVWDAYLLNSSQTDFKWIQHALQKNVFHFFVLSNLLSVPEKEKTKTSLKKLSTYLFKQKTFTLFTPNPKVNGRAKDVRFRSLFDKNLKFSRKTKKIFPPKKKIIKKNIDSVVYLLTNYPGWIFSMVNPMLFLHKHNCINSAGTYIVKDISFDSFITLTRFVPIRFQNRFFQLQGKTDFWQNKQKTSSFNKLTKINLGSNENLFKKDFLLIKKELFYLKFKKKHPKSKKSFILHPLFLSKYQVEKNLKISNFQIKKNYLKFLASFHKEQNLLKLSPSFSNLYSLALGEHLKPDQKQKLEKGTKTSFEKSQKETLSFVSTTLKTTNLKKKQETRKKKEKTFFKTKSLLKMKKFFSNLSEPKIGETQKEFLFKKMFILKSYLLFPFSRLELFAEELSWSSQKTLGRTDSSLGTSFSNQPSFGKSSAWFVTQIKERKRLFSQDLKNQETAVGFLDLVGLKKRKTRILKVTPTFHEIFVQNKQTINNYCRLTNFKTLPLPLFSEKFHGCLGSNCMGLKNDLVDSFGKGSFIQETPTVFSSNLEFAKKCRLEPTNGSDKLFNSLSSLSLEDLQSFSYSIYTKVDSSNRSLTPLQKQKIMEEKTMFNMDPNTLETNTRLPFLKNSAFTFNLNARFKPQLSILDGFVIKEPDAFLRKVSPNPVDYSETPPHPVFKKPSKIFFEAFRLASGALLQRQIKANHVPIFKSHSFSKEVAILAKENPNQRKVDQNKQFLDSFEKMAGLLKSTKRKKFYLLTPLNQTLFFTQKSTQYFSKTSTNYKKQISKLLNKSNQIKKKSFKKLAFRLLSYHKKPLSQISLPVMKDLRLEKFYLRKQLMLSKNSFNQKQVQLSNSELTDLGLRQNKQKGSQFINFQLHQKPEINWTFFESCLSKQNQNFFHQDKKTELSDSHFHFNNATIQSPLRLVKLRTKKSQEKKQILKVCHLKTSFENRNKRVVKVTQDNQKVMFKKQTRFNERCAEVRELKVEMLKDEIHLPYEKPRKVSSFFRGLNIISKNFVNNRSGWKTFSFSYFLNKKTLKKQAKKFVKNKKSLFQNSIKIVKPLINPFQKQDDLFFHFQTSNKVKPNLEVQLFLSKVYPKREGINLKIMANIKRSNKKYLSSKLLEQPRSFHFFNKTSLTKRYSFVLTKSFLPNFFLSDTTIGVHEKNRVTKSLKQNKLKKRVLQQGPNPRRSWDDAAKVVENAKNVFFTKKRSSKPVFLTSNKAKVFNLKPNFESFTKRFLTLSGNSIPFRKISVKFPIIKTQVKVLKKKKAAKAKSLLLQKWQNKVFQNIYTIDFNSYFLLKKYSNPFYLSNFANFKRGFFNTRLKPLFSFENLNKSQILDTSLFGPEANLLSSSTNFSGKFESPPILPLKNQGATFEKVKTESSKDDFDENLQFLGVKAFFKGQPVKNYTFFNHNRAIYLFQLHFVISSLFNNENFLLYHEKPLKNSLFEKTFKTTSQTYLDTLRTKKINALPLTKTKWKDFDHDQSRLKGEVIFASPSLPFKIVDFKFFKKTFSEIHFLTSLDFITFVFEKKFHLNKAKDSSFLTTERLDSLELLPRRLDSKTVLGQFVRYGHEISPGVGLNQPGQIILLQSQKVVLRYAKPYLLSSGAICDLVEKDFININVPLFHLKYKSLKTEDIVQGIPKIEQLFEARGNLFNETGVPYLLDQKFQLYKKEYPIAQAVRKSIEFIQNYIIDGIQHVYQSQGVNISDKHIEIIVKQMTLKVRIVEPNISRCLEGDLVDLQVIEKINRGLGFPKAVYEPVVLGITKASLEIESFISAASFQETIKVLTKATIFQKCDFLRGLKENVILGNLLPTGTGEKAVSNLRLVKLENYFFTLKSRQKKRLP